MRIPDNISFEDASAIPEVWFTAFQAIIWHGNIQDGQEVLVHAGASGVGAAAIQLAKTKKNTKVYVTTSTDDKIQFCCSLGADKGFNYKEGPWLDKVVKETKDQAGLDIIVDFVGAEYFEQNIQALKTDGTLLIISLLSGSKVPNFDIAPVLRKRLCIKGSTLRARPVDYKIQLTKAFWEFAEPKFKAGSFKAAVDKIYDWKDVKEAHAYMEANKNMGKIVLRIGE